MTTPVLSVRDLTKTFTLHLQGGVRLPVLTGLGFDLHPGECVALAGPSGSGKSTFMRSLYGNYGVDGGSIRVVDGGATVELTALVPHALAAIRARTIGYVSQFLRVIPRVPALDIALEPLLALGIERDAALATVTGVFRRLALPEPLWHLSPTTFSGGEKQRVNLARTLAVPFPVLLLDEPTASLDRASRERVVALLLERKRAGAAIVGIFHDDDVRARLADRSIAFDLDAAR